MDTIIENHILFTYLHLAADPEQAHGLARSGCTAIAYETITDDHGGLPLSPMSEVAGRLAVIEGASHLKSNSGGRGVLISGVPGTQPAKVVIIGGGVVGMNAAKMAIGLGAQVTVLDRLCRGYDILLTSLAAASSLDIPAMQHLPSVQSADMVIGAVLVPGAAAPKLITRAQLGDMQKGAVLVDVAIDQGGCFETSRPTTHDDPSYIIDDIVHYCVTNMPGSVPRTSSEALNNATLPHVLALAEKGRNALNDNPHLANGLNVADGKIVYKAVLDALVEAETK